MIAKSIFKTGSGFLKGGYSGAIVGARRAGQVAAKHPYATGAGVAAGGSLVFGGQRAASKRNKPDRYLNMVRQHQSMGVIGSSIGGMTG